MAEVPLRLYTTPSTWIHRNRPPAIYPYGRIVAVEVGDTYVDGRFDLSDSPRLDAYRVPEHVAETAL